MPKIKLPMTLLPLEVVFRTTSTLSPPTIVGKVVVIDLVFGAPMAPKMQASLNSFK
jgi:hypothetical protein